MIEVKMQQSQVKKLTPKITVVGVGGAGGNAVNNMINDGMQGVEFLVCNTDAQALEQSLSDNKIQLGVSVTGGLGAGAKPDVGRAAAEESLDEVMQHLDGSNMVFITAGMGGGSGTGGAPRIAQACREKGILTVGVVTKPFHFEGTMRMKMAEAGIEEMQDYVDTLIVVPNQNLFRVANEKTTFAEAFKMADGVLQSGVRGITDLIVMDGLINLDFADVRSAMQEMGKAMMGTGEATGERRPLEAAEAAINNPLLDDVSMKGARGVIINVTGGYDMTLFEVDEACNRIRDEVDPEANIIFGSTFDEKLEGTMRVSVVATGIDVAQAKSSGFQGGVGITRVQPKTETQEEEGQKETETSSSNSSGTVVPAAQEQKPASIDAGFHAKAFPAAPAPLSTSVAPAATASAAAARKVHQEEPESEMFEQREFAAPTGPSAGGNRLRGSVYGESFIPPLPAQPTERQTPVSSAPVARKIEEPQAFAPSATRPATDPIKKTPSLFERITNPLRGAHPGGEAAPATTTETEGNTRTAPSLSQSGSSQGTLNIGKISDASSDDDLDIPAFLRRQAN